MDILTDLRWRNLVQDTSDPEQIPILSKGTTFYVGFDPTAPSLQVGNLVPLLVSAHLAKQGLKPLILFGGSTGAIGDPSGKNKERQLLSKEELAANVEFQKQQVSEIYSRLSLKAEFVNNLDWTKDVTLLEFLRDYGKHFTVNYMMGKEVVKSRLESSGISYAEFSYMLLQAFDYLHLYETRDCKLQIGGSDQWGNITAGLELIRRKVQGDAYAFSFPLITDSNGKKFGKSEDGAVWLDPARTSPYKFHQFWLNISDEDALNHLKTFTFLTQDEITAIESQMKESPEKRHAQVTLADEICRLVHGEDALQSAKKSAEVLFGGSLDGIDDSALKEIFSDVPSVSLVKNEAMKLSLTEFFVQAGAANSNGEAKRLITGGGAYINQQRASSPGDALSDYLSSGSSLVILRSGKKKYFLAELTDG